MKKLVVGIALFVFAAFVFSVATVADVKVTETSSVVRGSVSIYEPVRWPDYPSLSVWTESYTKGSTGIPATTSLRLDLQFTSNCSSSGCNSIYIVAGLQNGSYATDKAARTAHLFVDSANTPMEFIFGIQCSSTVGLDELNAKVNSALDSMFGMEFSTSGLDELRDKAALNSALSAGSSDLGGECWSLYEFPPSLIGTDADLTWLIPAERAGGGSASLSFTDLCGGRGRTDASQLDGAAQMTGHAFGYPAPTIWPGYIGFRSDKTVTRNSSCGPVAMPAIVFNGGGKG